MSKWILVVQASQDASMVITLCWLRLPLPWVLYVRDITPKNLINELLLVILILFSASDLFDAFCLVYSSLEW